MKKLILLISAILATSLLLIGCDNNHIDDDENTESVSENRETLAPDVEASAANVDKLYIGITLEETISIMGFRDRSVSSRLHPFVLEWDLDDGSVLCMTFVIEDYENVSAGWYNPDSGLYENGTQEISEMPEEILADIREKTLASKCTYAYVKNGDNISLIE